MLYGVLMFYLGVFVRKCIHCNEREIHLKLKENSSLTERFSNERRHVLDSIVVEYHHAPLEHFFYVLRCFFSSQLSRSPRSFNFSLTLLDFDIYSKPNFYFGALQVKTMMSAMESRLFESFAKGHLVWV